MSYLNQQKLLLGYRNSDAYKNLTEQEQSFILSKIKEAERKNNVKFFVEIDDEEKSRRKYI